MRTAKRFNVILTCVLAFALVSAILCQLPFDDYMSAFASSGWIKVDDTSTLVEYDGTGWLRHNPDNDAYTDPLSPSYQSGVYFKQFTQADAAGTAPSVSFTFKGTQVRFYGATRDDSGELNVYIDSMYVGTVNTLEPGRAHQYDKLLFESDELAYAEHTLTVQAVVNEEDVGKYMIVDAFEFKKDVPVDEDYDASMETDYDYMNLLNHKGPSGVPLGGIGTGCFTISPEGKFSKININNTDDEGNINYPKGTFLAYYEKDENGSDARRLERDRMSSVTSMGMKGFENVEYAGLMPFIDMNYYDDKTDSSKAKVSMHAYSGLVPNNIKDSAIPLVWIEVTVENPSDTSKEVGVALSWEDVIGRNIKDLKEGVEYDDFVNNAWDKGLVSLDGKTGGGAMEFENMATPATSVESFSLSGMSGLLQSSDRISPRKYTYQNYNNNVAILGVNQDGVDIGYLPCYNVDNDAEFGEFVATGAFAQNSVEKTSLSAAGAQQNASAISMSTTLGAGESRTFTMAVAWFMPEDDIDYENDHPHRYFGTADFNRYYHNFFADIYEIIQYGYDNKQRIEDETKEWQQPILDSSYEDWMKFKIINSQVPIYYNSVLNKEGIFALAEGGMKGPLGTMDVRTYTFEYYSKFNIELDRSEMDLFTSTQKSNGVILHFDGDYYVGLADYSGNTPVPDNAYLDNTGGWLTQLAKDHRVTGDDEYILQRADGIRKAIRVVKTYIMGDVQIPHGPIMFDDCWVPDACSYLASQYLSWLNAAMYLADVIGDTQLYDECLEQYEKTYNDTLEYLWVNNEYGSYFVYGCKADGSQRLDNTMYLNQLAGQFISRSHMNGDIFPMEMIQASLVSMFKAQLWAYRDSNFRGPRVWDLYKEEAFMYTSANPNEWQDTAPSTSWAFYLDCNVGYNAFQAGFVDDAFLILRNTQLAYMDKGTSWAQNLWDLGNVSRMDVAMSWWLTDLMAGSNLDVNNHTLYLAPLVRPGDQGEVLKYPVYFSDFWAEVTVDTVNKTVTYTITKKVTDKNIVIETVRSEGVGIATDDAGIITLAQPFYIEEGSQLVFEGSDYDTLTRSDQQPFILQNASKVAYPSVDAEVNTVETPEISVEPYFGENIKVTLDVPSGTEVYYTVDGSDPAEGNAVLYTRPFEVSRNATVKARSFRDGEWGLINVKRFSDVFGIDVGGTNSGWSLNDGLEGDIPYVSGSFGLMSGSASKYSGSLVGDDMGMPSALSSQNYVGTGDVGASMQYGIDVDPGLYTVKLYFAEFFQNSAGLRRFGVKINDKLVLTDFDPFTEANGKNKVVCKTFYNVKVEDTGRIIVDVFNENPEQNAVLNAIVVEKQDDVATVDTTGKMYADVSAVQTSYSSGEELSLKEMGDVFVRYDEHDWSDPQMSYDKIVVLDDYEVETNFDKDKQGRYFVRISHPQYLSAFEFEVEVGVVSDADIVLVDGNANDQGEIVLNVEADKSNFILNLQVSKNSSLAVFADENLTQQVGKIGKAGSDAYNVLLSLPSEVNTFWIKVVAEDGVTENIYKLTVNRPTTDESAPIYWDIVGSSCTGVLAIAVTLIVCLCRKKVEKA